VTKATGTELGLIVQLRPFNAWATSRVLTSSPRGCSSHCQALGPQILRFSSSATKPTVIAGGICRWSGVSEDHRHSVTAPRVLLGAMPRSPPGSKDILADIINVGIEALCTPGTNSPL